MKCSNCGFEVPDGAAFCEKCGWKKETELTEQSNKTPSEKQPFGETVKTKIHDFWNGLDFFCKIATVALTVAVLLFFGAMLWGNFCTVVISVLQIAGLIVALLMHKGKIKWGKEWTKYLILVLAIVFVFLNFSSYSWFESAEATIQENANVPVSAAECIGKNKTDVINNLRRAGFRNVHEETIADLEIADAAKDGVVEAISINGVSDFKGNEEFKKDAKVVVTYHTYKCVSMPFASKDIKNMEENEIYEALKEIGFISIETEEVFDLDPDTTDAECEYGLSINGTSVFEKNAEFPINAEVTIVTHRVYDKYTVTISVDFLSSIFFDLYDVEMNVDGNKEVLKHGEDGVYTYQMPSGKYTVTFRNVDSTSVKGTAEFELYEDMEIGYQISCYSEEVKVEELYTEKKSAVGENEAYVPCAEDACYDKNYQEILSTFKDAGFTNIKTEILYDIVWGFTEEGAVESVSINGNENFKKGDIFLKDAPIVITYHMKEEDDPNKEVEATKHTIETPNNEGPLYYTTNNYEQACEGNCGVFAYKSKGGVYDIYWIVDFEDGYIYKFTEGNGENTCDRLAIEEGHLNTAIEFAYHLDGDRYVNYLHFKYVGHPETLILVDNNGFKIEFTTTDLENALKIRDRKSIRDY